MDGSKALKSAPVKAPSLLQFDHRTLTIDHSQALLAWKQLVAVNRPDGVTVNYLYEGDAGLPAPNPNTGRLKVIRQPRGDTTFGYDTAGRLSTITAPDGGKLTYGYDGSLLLSTTWSNGAVNGSVSRTYNTRTFVENGVTKTGSDFWVASESVNGGNTVNFSYDLDGLLTGANTTVNGSAVNFTINRDAQNGLITGSSIGGVADNISYNGFAEPIGYNAAFNGSSLYNVSYVRDAIGRISSKTETVNGVTTTFGYHYDLAGRLTGVDKNGIASSTYTYDSNGNRLSYSGELGSFSGAYDAQDRLLSYGDFVYEYTANGELSKKTNTVTGEVTSYQFDAMGNLMHVTLPNGKNIDYVIDAQNRRVGKKVNGVLMQGWLYRDQLNIAAEIDGGGNVVARFVGGYMIKGGQTYRLIRDQVGSVRQVVNVSSGVPFQETDYDEFGSVLRNEGEGFQPFGFAGGLYDSDTGLVRFGFRDYDPMMGRWLSKDPIGFRGGSSNIHEYVNSDPINFVDPTGLCPTDSSFLGDFLEKYGNGGLSGTLNGGAGFGMTIQMTISRDGLDGYLGFGFVEGFGVSVGPYTGISDGPNSGITVNASASGGFPMLPGWGGEVSVSAIGKVGNPNVGTNGTGTVGWGFGAGGGVTVGVTF